MCDNEEILRNLRKRGLINDSDFDELIKDFEVSQEKEIKQAKNALPDNYSSLGFA